MKYKILFWLFCQLPSVYFIVQQQRERTLISEYIEKNDVRTKTPWLRAIAMSQALRRDFRIDEENFQSLNLNDRPFLREDTAFLLQNREGLCGEGTRVLINLLYEMGYDATRLTLYDRHLHASHTLVSVIIEGEEIFIDSINSKSKFNNLLTSQKINSSDFPVLPYIEDLAERRKRRKSLKEESIHTPIEQAFFDKFWVFSYEAIPFSKIAKLFRMEMKGINLKRPPSYISILAERPHTIMAIFYGVFVNALAIMGLLLRRQRRKLQAQALSSG